MSEKRTQVIEYARAIVEAPSRSVSRRLSITHEADLARALLDEVAHNAAIITLNASQATALRNCEQLALMYEAKIKRLEAQISQQADF